MPPRERRSGSRPQVIAEEMENTLRQATEHDWADQINCHQRPELYADYEVAPSEERAEWLCAGCPLRTLCRDFGNATKPGWGVWGGIAWRNGRKAHLEEKLVDKSLDTVG